MKTGVTQCLFRINKSYKKISSTNPVKVGMWVGAFDDNMSLKIDCRTQAIYINVVKMYG